MLSNSVGRRERARRPFYRTDRGLWYVHLGGKQVNLGPDEAKAHERYYKLLGSHGPISDDTLVDVVIEHYLEHVKLTKSLSTQHIYAEHLVAFSRFMQRAFRGLTVAELKPFHLVKFRHTLTHKVYSPNTLHSMLRHVKTCFNWAAAQGLIPCNPVAKAEMPPKTSREIVVTPEQWTCVMHHAKGEEFRDLLTLYKETGARPGEIMLLEARHLIREHRAAVFDRLSSKGHRYNRVIYFTDTAWAIVLKWAERHPTGPIVRNEDGRPWTNSALNCRLVRLKKHIGFKLMPYALRHAFATEMLTNGRDAVTVAQLMGHRDLTMVANVYGHLAAKHDYLRDQLNRGLTRPGPAAG